MFIPAHYEFKIRDDLTLKSDKNIVESVFLELSGVSCGNNVFVGAIYRPPVIELFNDSLFRSLDLINKTFYSSKC